MGLHTVSTLGAFAQYRGMPGPRSCTPSRGVDGALLAKRPRRQIAFMKDARLLCVGYRRRVDSAESGQPDVSAGGALLPGLQWAHAR